MFLFRGRRRHAECRGDEAASVCKQLSAVSLLAVCVGTINSDLSAVLGFVASLFSQVPVSGDKVRRDEN